MAKRDFYQVLGVSKTATQEEIRKAYRKLARQFHPDINKDPDAQKRFTEVQEAYDVLGDEAKRRTYDRVGQVPGGAGGRPGAYSWSNVEAPGAGGAGMSDVDLEDLGSMFEAFFGSRAGGMGGAGVGVGGREQPAGRSRRRARAEPAPEAQAELTIPFMAAAKGGVERFRMPGVSTIEVKIPKGIRDGARLRIRGAVPARTPAQTQGDLVLTIRIAPHPLFRRDQTADGSLDIHLDLPLTIAEATLGATVGVPTLGDAVELRVPPGTASGTRLRLRGRGVEDERGRTGDLYAIVKVVPPQGPELSEAERRALTEISGRFPSPRGGPDWPGPAS